MKDKLQAVASWFFTCFGITMIGMSLLVVPENAFAQSAGSCDSICCTSCGGTTDCIKSTDPVYTCWMTCKSNCDNCVSKCNGDTTCEAKCKGDAGAGNFNTGPLCNVVACLCTVMPCSDDICYNAPGCAKNCVCFLPAGTTKCKCK